MLARVARPTVRWAERPNVASRLRWLLLLVAALALVPSALRPGLVPVHRDLLDFFLPMKVLFGRAVRDGSLPFWDPWTLGGHPFLANLQSQVFYPPNWLFAVLPASWGLSVTTAGHLAWGGAGTGLLARDLGRRPVAASLAAVAFLAGGFQVSLTDLHNQLCTQAWLPWVLLAGLRHGRRPTLGSLGAWTAACSVALLGGAPQLALLGGALSAAVALVVAWGGGRPARVATLGAAALVPVLTALACAAQLGPFLELVVLSDRAAGADFAQAGRHALAWTSLASFGLAGDGPLAGSAGPYVRSLYVGPLVLLLAAAGALRRDGVTRLLIGATVASLLLAILPGIGEVGSIVGAAVPWLRYPVKNACLAALAIPLLAAGGMDLALTAARRTSSRRSFAWRRLAWLAVVLVGTDLVLAHARYVPALPAASLLAPTPAISLLQADTAADGPRVHALANRDDAVARARLHLDGRGFEAERRRVELLTGSLPGVFRIHATWGGAAMTWQQQARRLEDLDAAPSPTLLAGSRVGYVLGPAERTLPLPVIPVAAGAARLHVVPHVGRGPEREWRGPNRAVGAAGLPAPSEYPGWREGPPGTWTFRPTGWPWWSLISLVTWTALSTVAVRAARRRRRVDRPASEG